MFDIHAAVETHAFLSAEYGKPNRKEENSTGWHTAPEHSFTHKWRLMLADKYCVEHGFNNLPATMLIIETAVEMLPGILRDWKSFTDRGLEFLEDTLNYLQGGVRKTPLVTVFSLIDHREDYLNPDYRQKLVRRIEYLIEPFRAPNNTTIDVSKCISMWFNQSRGTEDLAWSIYFLLLADRFN